MTFKWISVLLPTICGDDSDSLSHVAV